MGTFQTRTPAENAGAANINRFYSTNAWIEGAAEEQLTQVAQLSGVSNIAAFPDLHPGKYGPVGCAVLADRLYPQLIGNDIGCGMSLFAIDLPLRKLKPDKAAEKLRVLSDQSDRDNTKWLKQSELPTDLHNSALGTIGGGNHFCELQRVGSLIDHDTLYAHNLKQNDLMLLVHSGSRSLGASVFETIKDAFCGLDPDSEKGRAYLSAHSQAVRWASLNRHLIAERAASALKTDVSLICDAPHNLIEDMSGGFLHRKGAAKADQSLVPLAGSRDALSYLLKPMATSKALSSLAHGSGRKYDRKSMLGRAGRTRSERDNMARNSFGGLIICEDRQLLIEEAPNAYKNPAHIVRDLQDLKLAEPIAHLEPLITFKKAMATQTRIERDTKPTKQRRRHR